MRPAASSNHPSTSTSKSPSRPAPRKTTTTTTYSMKPLPQFSSVPLPSTTQAILVLSIWFIANVFITIYSKSLYKDQNFPYPLLLTSIHFTFTSVMAMLVNGWRRMSYQLAATDEACASAAEFGGQPESLGGGWLQRCLIFSIIFTTNIWLSNYSLLVVTIQVHQIIRTTIPLLTMFFSWFLFHERYSLTLLPSVAVVILGVLLSVWSDRIVIGVYGCTVVVVGCVFSSLKGIMTRNVQLKMDTIDVLRIVCPISVCMLLVASLASGEFASAYHNYDSRITKVLAVQGLTAALLNYVSFKCAALNSPLTMNIAGNVKQVLTPLIATSFIKNTITPAGYAGLIVAFLGAIWYTFQINRLKQSGSNPTQVGAEATAHLGADSAGSGVGGGAAAGVVNKHHRSDQLQPIGSLELVDERGV